MATIGQRLDSPESGWQRIDERDTRISYSGNITSRSDSNYHSNTCTDVNSNSIVKFKFYGTKLRIICGVNTGGIQGVSVILDGVEEEISFVTSSLTYKAVSFEKVGLSLDTHEVIISTNGSKLGLDAIDIDSDGFLAAPIGSQVSTPELGWRRYQDSNERISYFGNWDVVINTSYYNNGDGHSTTDPNSLVVFNFYGSKLRIIINRYNNKPNNVPVKIDGEICGYIDYYTSSIDPEHQYWILGFEKLDLELGEHTVEISCPELSSGLTWNLDAIDIDSDGYLIIGIGQQLSSPESGWQRIDDTDGKIHYSSNFTVSNSSDTNYNSTLHYIPENVEVTEEDKIWFNFYGTKLRLITPVSLQYTSKLNVVIDGRVYHANAKMSEGSRILIFEITNLEQGEHAVEIYPNSNDLNPFGLDAIDIDDNGYMIASIGDTIDVPDLTWKRYQETASGIVYIGNWNYATNDDQYNDKNAYWTENQNARAKIAFYGTKLRIIANTNSNRPNNVSVTIDEEFRGYARFSTTTSQVNSLVYEVRNLKEGIHLVELSCSELYTGYSWNIDAIDIDETGYLVTQVGASLPSPETGWKRIDDSDINIAFFGSLTTESDSNHWNSSIKRLDVAKKDKDCIRFRFFGTKFRLIGFSTPNASRNCFITVDGVEYSFSQYNETNVYCSINFELVDLFLGLHEVEITAEDSTSLYFDAIDIDENGYLIIGIGQQLSSPESGWRRYNDSSSAFEYVGTGWSYVSNSSGFYNSDRHTTIQTRDSVSFKFYGTDFRIIGSIGPNDSTDIKISIDGKVQYYSQYNANKTTYPALVFEKLNLPKAVHEVVITNLQDKKCFTIDAVDIGYDGILIIPTGQSVSSVEPGWRRFNNTDTRVYCVNNSGNLYTESNTNMYGGSQVWGYYGDIIQFRFRGTRFRLISAANVDGPLDIVVSIDGIEHKTSEYKSQYTAFCKIVFQKFELSNDIHEVKIFMPYRASGKFGLDAIDIEETGTLVHPLLTEKSSISEMDIGDCIPCRYIVNSSGAVGVFTDFGTCSVDELPVSGTATPNGLFYFIKADRGLLVADRVIQTNIPWTTLNSNKFIEGGFVNVGKRIAVLNGSGYLYHAYKSDLSPTKVTVRVTAYRDDWNTLNTETIISKFQTGGYGMQLNGSGTGEKGFLSFTVYINNSYQYVGIEFSKLSPGWHELVGTYDGNTLKFFVDGILVNSKNVSGAIKYSVNNYLVVGADAGNASNVLDAQPYYFNGKISEVAIWNDALTDSEVVRLSGKNIPLRYRNLVSLWDFDLNTGAIVIDKKSGYHFSHNQVEFESVDSFNIFVRSISGGVIFADPNGNPTGTNYGKGAWPTDNEWDKYIVNSDLDCKIPAGDINIWHWDKYSWCKETVTNNNANRVCRGYISNNVNGFAAYAMTTNNADIGFRPVIELVEEGNTKQKDYWR